MTILRRFFWCFAAATLSCSSILFLCVSNTFKAYIRHDHEERALRISQNRTDLRKGYITIRQWNNIKAHENYISASISAEIHVSGKTSKDWCIGLKTLYPLNINFSQTNGIIAHYKPVNNLSVAYILNPKQACDKNLHILSIVKSKVNNFKLRQAIRETWGKLASNGSDRLIFSLGLSREMMVQKKVRRESFTYRDILQGNFIDNYFNNTIKTTMEIQWAARACRNTRFVFLVDDDIIVNFKTLKDHVSRISKAEENDLFSGNLKKLEGPMRNKHGKWFMSKFEFPYTCYPPYISGSVILTSRKVVQRIYEALPYVRRFKYDDVYLGIIIQKLGIKPQRNPYVSMRRLDTNKLRTSIASHGFKNAREYLNRYRNLTKSN